MTGLPERPRRHPTRPTVVFDGQDSQQVAAQWTHHDASFRLVASDGASLPDRQSVNLAVIEVVPTASPERRVETIRDRYGEIPVVLLMVGDSGPLSVPSGVVSTVSIDEEQDRVETIAALEELIDSQLALERDQTLLDSFLAHVPMAVYAKDRQGRHVAASDGVIDMIGPQYLENDEGKRHCHPADLLGKTDFDVHLPGLAEKTAEDERQIIDEGKTIDDEVESSFGEEATGTYALTTKAPWQDRRGNVIGLFGITRDISELKQLENQLNTQNQRLRRLTTMVSHDIRNPLSVALGRLELARETGATEHFDAIETALERVESLVTDVLHVTDMGVPVTDPDRLRIGPAARSAFDGVETRGMELVVADDTRIFADRGRLVLLFETLFENASEHARSDGTPVTVTVGQLEAAEGFYVADDGDGIPPQRRSEVFEPRLSAAAESGIGLSRVAAIADAHNWSVSITDSEDGGARFEFEGVREIGA
ncbi:MAG: sensor histidine kinase [Halorhabdus sp.]